LADLRDTLRDAAREALVHGAFFLPAARRKAIDRWLRGREEHRKLQQADVVFMSWAKSGRTWLRLMLSRFYQLRFGLPETAFLEFDNLKRRVPEIPSVFYTHGNYLRDYTGDWQTKRHFYDKRILFMARDPRDVAVSQYFQWRYRMRPWKKLLNDYPPHGEDVSIYDFVMHAEAGLEQILEFYDVWAREMPKVRDVHIVRYEDLRARTEQVLGEVLAFLGTPARPEELADAVRYARLENMRQIERSGTFWRSGRRLVAGDKGNPDSFKVRRAKVGGWRDYFDDAQVAAIDARVSESLSPIYGYDAHTAKSDDPGKATSSP
jgi:hypothetical protein